MFASDTTIPATVLTLFPPLTLCTNFVTMSLYVEAFFPDSTSSYQAEFLKQLRQVTVLIFLVYLGR